jgi:ABC-type transport system involved in multi-copper enzyme maturation permease subunit
VSAATLLGHHWRRHRQTLLVIGLGLALFELAITRIAPETEQAEAMRRFIALLPAPLTSLVTELLENVTPQGILAFGYAHPFAVLLLSLWVVRVGAGALAGEIGLGTMDLLAARPVSRASQVWAALAAMLLGLLALVAAAWAGTSLGLATRSIPDLGATAFLAPAFMGWLLFAAFGALTLAISASRKSGGEAIALASGVLAGSFVLDYLARLWEPISALRRLSLFTYAQPQAIVREGVAAADVVVLAAVAALAAAAAFALFARRDL